MSLETEQFSQIIEMIGKVSDKQDSLHGDFREFKGVVTTQVGDNTKEIDTIKLWTNIKLVMIIPIVAVLREIAVRFGLIR